MIILDGIEYDVKTPDENLDDVITFVNDYCAAKNVKNSAGEVIYIEPNEANPLYQMFRGFSYLTTIMQKLIYSAGCSMSIAESSERQLLNLSDIAGIKRTQATRTIISGVIFANEDGPGAVDCVITRSLTATITIAGMDIVFHPAFDVTIPAGESRSIILIAEQYGSYNISANTIIQFDTPVAGFRTMSTNNSTPGQGLETIASLRNRLQRRAVEGTQVERAESAIQNLEGVSMCSIFFNYSPSEAVSIPYGNTSISVPPRQAILMVQGWSVEPNAIARTFYRYLLCKTAGESVPGVQTQKYITHSNQELTVNIIPPVQQPIYIKIYIKNSLSYEQINGIKDVICSLAGSLLIGQSITSVDITNVVMKTYTNLTVQGAEVALIDEDPEYRYIQTPAETAVFFFNLDNIHVVEV